MLLYKQHFYRIDVGGPEHGMNAEQRARMAKATMALCRADGVVVATCSGGRDPSEPPEIALVMPAEADAGALASRVQEALAHEGLEAEVAVDEEVRYHAFSEEQVQNVQRAVEVEDVERAGHAVDVCCALPVQRAEIGAARVVPGVPLSHTLEPFSVNAETYARMKEGVDSGIEDEIRHLLAVFEALSTETKTNAAVVTMIANGVLTVGRAMWSAYRSMPWGGSASFWLGELIASAGGIQAVSPVAAAIASVLAFLFITSKDVRNGLVFLNGDSSEIELVHDFMLHGQRKSAVTSIPGFCNESPKPAAYPCGLFVYKKHSIFTIPSNATDHTHPALPVPPCKGFPIGFHGTTAGLAFKRTQDGALFSVGIDSPTFERNSVCIIPGDNARHAAEIADDTATGEGTLEVGESRCVVRHAEEWGSVNYAICTIDSGRSHVNGHTNGNGVTNGHASS